MTKVWNRITLSLPLQIIMAVVVGLLLGGAFPDGQLKPASEVGKAIIHWVKLIAGPFLFLTIVASTVEVKMTAAHAVRLVAIALLNTAIAIAIGMWLAHFFLSDIRIEAIASAAQGVKVPDISAGLSTWMKTFTPPSLFAPFVQNEILIIAFLALFTGMALRSLYQSEGAKKLAAIAQTCEQIRAVPGVFLHWLIRIIPLAVMTVVAGAVSEYGYGIFATLFRYVGAVITGFALQSIFVYGTWIFLVARMKPSLFFSKARVPLLYSFGVNSSLATLPLTLKALKEMGVSDRSASLGAGDATNLNNDGIVLYEALAVFFVAQLAGIPLTETQMISAAFACIVAAMGITGIPEAGFISLSVVVATMGLPLEALPLLLAVDWIVARGRSVINVLSDMTLSIAMDATGGKTSSISKNRKRAA